MEIEYQLDEWVKGNPMHNDDRGECCPDFSCCNGKLAELEVRKRFVKAYHDNDVFVLNEMLMMFLKDLLKDANVYTAGDSENYEAKQ